MLLEDKVAIVTGGGSGIGRAIALGLAQEGARVAIADINLEAAQATAQEIGRAGGTALALPLDVSQNPQVEAMVQQVLSRFGTIDILINDAGYHTRSLVVDMTEEEWDRTLDVNLKGAFLCSRAVIRHLVPKGRGKIVNVASGTGLRGAVQGAHYAASKAGMIAFTRSLALELARHHINVNAIGPGRTDTPFFRTDRSSEEIEEALKSGQIGKPGDLVGLVVFLCSAASDPITGQFYQRDIYLGHPYR